MAEKKPAPVRVPTRHGDQKAMIDSPQWLEWYQRLDAFFNGIGDLYPLSGDGDEYFDGEGHWTKPAGMVPVNGIIGFTGNIADIPPNFAMCDGVANAPGPDLRIMFIV